MPFSGLKYSKYPKVWKNGGKNSYLCPLTGLFLAFSCNTPRMPLFSKTFSCHCCYFLLFFTYYFLLVNHNLLLYTRHSLNFTHFLWLLTWPFFLVSRYSLPMTCHSLIATISLILVTFYQLLATLIADYLFKKSLHKPCENTGFYWPVFSRKKTES